MMMKFPAVRTLNNKGFNLLKRVQKYRPAITTACHNSTSSRYHEEHKRSIENPSDYWAEAADKLVWFKKWNKVVDTSKLPFTDWFVGGEINHCYNSVDRHVDDGRGEQIALIHESPITNSLTKITYSELLKQVSTLAGDLAQNGIKKGDRVLIYMPMIPEAVVAMQATVRIGAIHVVVFGGFAAKELSVRIDHCKPTAVISASCGIEPSRVVPYKPILDEALRISTHKPKRVVIYQRPGMEPANLNKDTDVSWEDVMNRGRTHDCVPVESNHPMYVLYTSGTTGTPKGAVRPTGSHCVRLHWSMEAIYDVKPGEVYWAASDLGWTVGHSYICHSPLVNGNTSIIFEVYWANADLGWAAGHSYNCHAPLLGGTSFVLYEVFWAAADLGWAVGHSYGCYAPLLTGTKSLLYEGKPVGTPDASTFFRIINDHKVACLFTAPTALRSIKREDPDAQLGKKFDLSSLRSLFVAGEHCDTDTAEWSSKAFGDVPVIDHWWQTETGSPITSSCLGLGNRTDPPKGSSGLPVPGWDLRVVDDKGDELENGQLGNLVAKLPLAPGAFKSLFENDERYLNTYFSRFKGFYDTMDAGVKDEEGYISVMSRTDDVINVAGHRLSCGHIEEAINLHDQVVECAVVAMDDSLKGSIPVAYVVFKEDAGNPEPLFKQVIALVREHIGPVAAFRHSISIQRLPKTRSGKTPRNSLEALINRKPYKISPTIEDASVYTELEESVESFLQNFPSS